MSLVGIYSFPKSGNTWIRVIVANVMNRNANDIPDLHQQELSRAIEFNGLRFFKHHGGANLQFWKGEALHTRHVIHVRRHPLDVFLSYLNFVSDNVTGTAPLRFSSVDDIHGTELFDLYFNAFTVMGHLSVEFAGTTKNYFDHNKYWTTQTEVPATLLRYEDMVDSPITTLRPVQEMLGIDQHALEVALSKTASDTKPDGKFFWKQQKKNYLNYLSQQQIDQFIRVRGNDCRSLGYPPEDF